MRQFNGLEFKEQFHGNSPYEYVVIDDFLDGRFFKELRNEIIDYLGQRKRELRKSRDYVFARNKFEISEFDEVGPLCHRLRLYLLSEEFGVGLSDLWGSNLVVDPEFHGGGIHAGGKGSYLDMHTDFAWHPDVEGWRRRLNILLYLNDDWRTEYGGQLKLRHIEQSVEETSRINPLGNRLVIMRTDDFTVHGYDEINFPDGDYRLSIACYAYEPTDFRSIDPVDLTTKWYPTHGTLRRLIAPVMHHLVGWKKTLLGSRTGKNRKAD